jgi:hypothetical protein
MLLGRRTECATLDELLGTVRAGRGQSLVLRGEPGIGKTALLDYLHERASGCAVARASGVQSEMEPHAHSLPARSRSIYSNPERRITWNS